MHADRELPGDVDDVDVVERADVQANHGPARTDAQFPGIEIQRLRRRASANRQRRFRQVRVVAGHRAVVERQLQALHVERDERAHADQGHLFSAGRHGNEGRAFCGAAAIAGWRHDGEAEVQVLNVQAGRIGVQAGTVGERRGRATDAKEGIHVGRLNFQRVHRHARWRECSGDVEPRDFRDGEAAADVDKAVQADQRVVQRGRNAGVLHAELDGVCLTVREAGGHRQGGARVVDRGGVGRREVAGHGETTHAQGVIRRQAHQADFAARGLHGGPGLAAQAEHGQRDIDVLGTQARGLADRIGIVAGGRVKARANEHRDVLDPESQHLDRRGGTAELAVVGQRDRIQLARGDRKFAAEVEKFRDLQRHVCSHFSELAQTAGHVEHQIGTPGGHGQRVRHALHCARVVHDGAAARVVDAHLRVGHFERHAWNAKHGDRSGRTSGSRPGPVAAIGGAQQGDTEGQTGEAQANRAVALRVGRDTHEGVDARAAQGHHVHGRVLAIAEQDFLSCRTADSKAAFHADEAVEVEVERGGGALVNAAAARDVELNGGRTGGHTQGARTAEVHHWPDACAGRVDLN